MAGGSRAGGKGNGTELGDLGLNVLRAHILVAPTFSHFWVQLMLSRSFQVQYKENYMQMTSVPHSHTLSLAMVSKTWLKQLLPPP